MPPEENSNSRNVAADNSAKRVNGGDKTAGEFLVMVYVEDDPADREERQPGNQFSVRPLHGGLSSRFFRGGSDTTSPRWMSRGDVSLSGLAGSRLWLARFRLGCRLESVKMSRFIAFLRAINAGPRRSVKMELLRRIFDSLHFADVATFLGRGNVVFRTSA